MSQYDTTLFYWLQLKEDFFDEDAIEWLEDQPNGKEYCLFYLKLCLKSLKTNGILIRKVGDILIPYDYVKLAEITKTKQDTVLVAMELLIKIGLIKILENGELYLTQVEEMIGSRSKGAFKKSQQRLANSSKKLIGGQMSAKCPTDIDIELDIDKDIEYIYSPRENEKKENEIPYKEIVEYLNNKTNSNYKHTTQKTRDLIKARFNQGFKLEDFIKVIDKKCDKWLNDEKMCIYLRPETLFGNKFEGYLNEKDSGNPKPSWFGEYQQELENNKNNSENSTNEESIKDLQEFFKP